MAPLWCWITAIAVCFWIAVGCNPALPEQRAVVWDFSKRRTIDRLSGGKWVPNQAGLSDVSYVYYIGGDEDLMLSIILPDKKRFEIPSVRHVYAQKHGNSVSEINIATFGYGQDEAIDRVQDMHVRWGGRGIGDIKKWIEETAQGSLDTYNTVIYQRKGREDANVMASIVYNFGESNNRWFIMVQFYWPPDDTQAGGEL